MGKSYCGAWFYESPPRHKKGGSEIGTLKAGKENDQDGQTRRGGHKKMFRRPDSRQKERGGRLSSVREDRARETGATSNEKNDEKERSGSPARRRG